MFLSQMVWCMQKIRNPSLSPSPLPTSSRSYHSFIYASTGPDRASGYDAAFGLVLCFSPKVYFLGTRERAGGKKSRQGNKRIRMDDAASLGCSAGIRMPLRPAGVMDLRHPRSNWRLGIRTRLMMDIWIFICLYMSSHNSSN